MKVTEIAIQVLNDTKEYLRQLSRDVYAQPLDILSGASIGQHTRHFVEFYQCLITQISASSKPLIDYAARIRNPQIETDPGYTIEVIDEIILGLRALNHNLPCRLECAEHLPQGDSYPVNTSLERELIYNIEHTIHHLAIIKIGLKSLARNIILPEHFGIAPSTVKYQSECAQ